MCIWVYLDRRVGLHPNITSNSVFFFTLLLFIHLYGRHRGVGGPIPADTGRRWGTTWTSYLFLIKLIFEDYSNTSFYLFIDMSSFLD